MTDAERVECIRTYARNFARGSGRIAATGDPIALIGEAIMLSIDKGPDQEILDVLNDTEDSK